MTANPVAMPGPHMLSHLRVTSGGENHVHFLPSSAIVNQTGNHLMPLNSIQFVLSLHFLLEGSKVGKKSSAKTVFV
jgi:hypothetical protein